MSKKCKMRALEILSEEVCTVEMCAVIKGTIHHELLAITDASHKAISLLIKQGYNISIDNGKIIVDNFEC